MRILFAVWAALISVFTAWSTYGQYYSSSILLRPSVGVEVVPESSAVKKVYGQRSHMLAIRNAGSVPAKGVKVTAITRFDGSIVHQDVNQSSGVLPANRTLVHGVHVPDEHLRSFDPGKHVLLEEVVISYEGLSGVFRFWCTPSYQFSVTYQLQAVTDRWVYQTEPAEKEECR